MPDIQTVEWEELLPESLKQDEGILAMLRAISQQKRKIAQQIWNARIWQEIDRMPEDALDAMAYDLKVDWWNYDYTLEEKRTTLKGCFSVHQGIGTKGAVETAISGIYKNTKVEEWWEYGADPYNFRLLIDATYEDADPVKHQQILDRVAYYKNVRSHMDAVEYYAKPEGEAVAYGMVAQAGIAMCITVTVEVPDWTPTDTVLTGTRNTLNLNRRRLI